MEESGEREVVARAEFAGWRSASQARADPVCKRPANVAGIRTGAGHFSTAKQTYSQFATYGPRPSLALFLVLSSIILAVLCPPWTGIMWRTVYARGHVSSLRLPTYASYCSLTDVLRGCGTQTGQYLLSDEYSCLLTRSRLHVSAPKVPSQMTATYENAHALHVHS